MEQPGRETHDGRREALAAETAEIAEELKALGLEFPRVVFAKRLAADRDADGKEFSGSVYWVEFEDGRGERAKSGKLFVPHEGFNSHLVALYGGLPGDSIVGMERRLANGLLEGGYALWVSRHDGTSLNARNIESFFGTPEILDETAATGKTAVGAPLHQRFLEDFADEPGADLAALSKMDGIRDITMVGHSFGAASITHAIGKDRELNQGRDSSKVRRIISINGLIGDGTYPDDPDERIGGMRLTPRELEQNQIAKAKEMFEIPENPMVHDSYRRILEYTHTVETPGIDTVVITSPTDAYLSPSAAEDYYQRLPSGLLVYDLTQSDLRPAARNENTIFAPDLIEATPELISAANTETRMRYGASQHTAPNFRGETLRRLIELEISGKKHRVMLQKQEAKK